ncbi:hypothetical protein [Campylobacter sp.]|uniref:hypothetical protein n=1 Tax=Campylobacter sp. TaxID=205 RepID=UPI0026DB3D08|nr:hypothetical protein [Campylobacter sp.]MDO4674438.1 hypothetical protein [Campylobacter sp.]
MAKNMHYETKKVAKQRSTTFYLSREILRLLREIADFENTSISIIVERSLKYARCGDFKKAGRIKKKTALHADRKRKFTNQNRKQKGKNFTKSIFDE